MALTNAKKCPDCGINKSRSEFYEHKGKTLAYCKPCQNVRAKEYQKRTNYGKSDKAWAKNPRDCEICSQSFYPATFWQRTCSKKCSAKLQNNKKKPKERMADKCLRCAKSLVGKKANAIYCSRACCSMDYAFKKRGGTRFTTTARRFEIYQRDNGKCYLCNHLLPTNGFELDHIIPHARGGGSEPSNLAVCCSKCNKSKGDRIGIAQLVKLLEIRPENC